MLCESCGHRNPHDANFCSSCGAPLIQASGDTTATVVPVDALGDTGEDELAIALAEQEEGLGVLVVKRGPSAGARFLLEQDLVKVGRHPESDIFLDDITVSRRHAEFVRQVRGHLVRDVGSLNGTYVNRERIEECDLHNGDEVQIGKFKLIYLRAAEGR
ncbi:MAG: FHA domain-containing protein [Actinobacteria bacterium]|nr:FHA domain-containing protein [Actinomycetota bacterium]